MKQRLFKGLCILILITFALYHFSGKNSNLPSDSQAARKLLLEKIPVGSSLNNASRIMQEYQFECHLKESQTFREYQNIDFLSCFKQAPQVPFICDSVWQIAIVHKNRVVSDILVAYGTGCL